MGIRYFKPLFKTAKQEILQGLKRGDVVLGYTLKLVKKSCQHRL